MLKYLLNIRLIKNVYLLIVWLCKNYKVNKINWVKELLGLVICIIFFRVFVGMCLYLNFFE